MRELSVCKFTGDKKPIDLEKLKKITFLTSTAECINCHLTKDGCLITIDSTHKIAVCNDCLFTFYQSLECYYSDMTDFEQCSVKLGSESYTSSKPGLKLLVNKIKSYFDIINQKHIDSFFALRQIVAKEQKSKNDQTESKERKKKEKEKKKLSTLYSQIRALQRENAKLSKNIEFLTSRIFSLSTENEKQKNVIEAYKKQITCMQNKIGQYKEQISHLNDSIDQQVYQLKGRFYSYLKLNILDCQTGAQSVKNIGISRSKANAHPIKEFQITYINDSETFGIRCKTLKHFSNTNVNPIVILETGRENDVLCLSLCANCVQQLIVAFQTVDINDNPVYRDDRHGIGIKCRSSFVGEHCYSCGRSNSVCYIVRIGSIEFKICDDCKKNWLLQFEEILKQLRSNG